MRNLILLIIAALLHWNAQAAECAYPVLPDPIAGLQLNPVAQLDVQYAYQTNVYKFIVCQRASLEARIAKLEPSNVQQAIVNLRSAEDRAIAELAFVYPCYRSSMWAKDSAKARKSCEWGINSSIKDRHPGEESKPKELSTEQVRAYGGIWSYRSLDFGRPGHCYDAACDRLFAVEVANWTPVTLSCNVLLNVMTARADSSSRVEQTVRLNPGDSIPAATATTYENAAKVEPMVTCQPAAPLPPPLRVPENCSVNWTPREFEFPPSLAHASMSGTALIEFAVPKTRGPPVDLLVKFADHPGIERAAVAEIKKLNMNSNCPGERFRVRVEYRAFPCVDCFQRGVVTVFRDG